MLNVTNWRLERLGEAPVQSQTVPEMSIANGGSLHGYTDCNQFGGTWERDGGLLALKVGPMTLRSCAEEVSRQA